MTHKQPQRAEESHRDDGAHGVAPFGDGTWVVQEMTQEQLEEMMERQGQSRSQGGKELEVSLEQQEGSSPQDSNQQCAPPALPSGLLSHALPPSAHI